MIIKAAKSVRAFIRSLMWDRTRDLWLLTTIHVFGLLTCSGIIITSHDDTGLVVVLSIAIAYCSAVTGCAAVALISKRMLRYTVTLTLTAGADNTPYCMVHITNRRGNMVARATVTDEPSARSDGEITPEKVKRATAFSEQIITDFGLRKDGDWAQDGYSCTVTVRPT